jgi:hypothetical protein
MKAPPSPLDHAADRLAMQRQRVDDAADIFDDERDVSALLRKGRNRIGQK